MMLNQSAKKYFSKEKLLLKAFGLSLTGNDSKAYKVYSTFILLALNVCYPFLELLEFFKHDFAFAAEHMLAYEFVAFISLSKTATIFWNRERFMGILNKLEEEPFIPDVKRGTEVEVNLINKCTTIVTVQAFAYWATVCISFVTTVLFTLYKRLTSSRYEDWEFSYGPFTLLNVTYSPNFEICWMYQNVSILSIAWHFITIDLLIAAVLVHVSYQFKIIQNMLVTLGSRCDTNEHQAKVCRSHKQISEKRSWEPLAKLLAETVTFHLETVKVMNELEEVFSMPLLITYINTLGMLSFMVFKTSALNVHDVRFLKSIAEVSGLTLQNFLICYWAEQVAYESESVGLAAYKTNFVGRDLRFQRSLITIIRRSQNAVRLTVGKFENISLATFMWIIKTSYSAFMVLRSTNVSK